MIATLDRPEALEPTSHVFAAERVPWLHIADGLPRYRTVPSEGTLMPPES